MPQRRTTKAPKTPGARPTPNQDRVRALRENRQKEIAHSKDMAKRMGVKKAQSAEDGERLHVKIAHAGLCSRRAAEKLIREGRVMVNGVIVMDMGVKVGDGDEVRVDGQVISEAKQYTLMLYKPIGVVTTLSDPQGRPTIAKYLPDYGCQLKPVGRLDMDTEGLLLVTNDGELANRLAHPRYGIEKEYHAVVRGVQDVKALNHLRMGVFFEGK